MAKENRLEDYQLFYMEIPSSQADELNDIQIIDVDDDHDQHTGLSDEQVSNLTSDMLAYQNRQADDEQPQASFNEQRQLFDN